MCSHDTTSDACCQHCSCTDLPTTGIKQYSGTVERLVKIPAEDVYYFATRLDCGKVMVIWSKRSFIHVPLVTVGDRITYQIDANGVLVSFEIIFPKTAPVLAI